MKTEWLAGAKVEVFQDSDLLSARESEQCHRGITFETCNDPALNLADDNHLLREDDRRIVFSETCANITAG